jgi:glycosyltransferase involved in cell wall biosynthesis
VIRENQIDLVHINTGLRHGKPAIIASRLTRRPCLCHVRMLDELIYFDKLFARFVDTYIFISGAVRENYVYQIGHPVPGAVVHNAINLDDFSIDVDVSQVRNEFGWTDCESLVGVVGRLDWWKGHDYFLEAMAEVVQQMPTVKGLIVGAPENSPLNLEYYRKLQAATKSLGLEDKVIFTGFREDIPCLMAAMDVVVLSSSSPEPFGRVVIEGMAAGKPVVATPAGGVLDIIENGVNGLLVPPKDSKAMAAAILRLLSDPERSGQMGQEARRRVEEAFTVQSHVAAIQQVYNVMLGPQEDHQATTEHHAISGVASGRSLPDTESGGFEGERRAHTETC